MPADGIGRHRHAAKPRAVGRQGRRHPADRPRRARPTARQVSWRRRWPSRWSARSTRSPSTTPTGSGSPTSTTTSRTARTRNLQPIPPTADPVFLGPGTAAAAGITGYTVDVPLLSNRVRLDDGPTLQRQVQRLSTTLAAYQLGLCTQLPASLDQADNGRDLVRIASPLAVTQLVLLAWWTLFLVVGSATEERSPELGLAKLRGLSQGQTGRFGLAEIVLLLVVAAPLGTVAGYLAVRAAGPHVFAPGTDVAFTSSVLLTVSHRSVRRHRDRGPRGPAGVPTPGRRPAAPRAVAAAAAGGAACSRASSSPWRSRASRSSSASGAANRARSRCSRPGMVAVVGGLLAGRLLVGVRPQRFGAGRGARQGRPADRLVRRGPATRDRAHRLGARHRYLPAADRRRGMDGRRAQPGRALVGRGRRGRRADTCGLVTAPR